MNKAKWFLFFTVLTGQAICFAGSEGAQLQQVISDRGAEEMKTKDLENKVFLVQEQEERKIRQMQKEITDQRYQIELLKQRQEKATQELEALNTDHADLNAKIRSLQEEKKKFEEESQRTFLALETEVKEFSNKQIEMDKDIFDLAQKRKRMEREIANKGMELQTLKASVSRVESVRADLESKTAELEADEMRVRTDWMQAKIQAAESFKQRDLANERMGDAKKKRDLAVRDLQIAQDELSKATRTRNEILKKTEQEIARYEKEIQAAQKSRIFAESEQIRLDAEVAKIREYGVRMKETRDQAMLQADQSEALVWKSNLNLETARSELSQKVSDYDKKGFMLAKEKARNEGLEEAKQAANLLNSVKSRQVSSSSLGRPWKLSTQCEAFAKPDRTSPAKGFVKAGQIFYSPEILRGWVQVQNSSGATVYVEENCGQYEN